VRLPQVNALTCHGEDNNRSNRRGNAPGAMIQVANTSTTREGKLQKWSM
jgi:hypothetical protein